MSQPPSRREGDSGEDGQWSPAQPSHHTEWLSGGDDSRVGPAGLPADLERHPRYRVLEWLGGGGMGTVYKARHLLMDRVVALKVINPGLVNRPAMVEWFRREVRTAARLIHPNIVTAYDADQAGSTHFLVMEYVQGVNLRQLLREKGRLPTDQACDFARQAAAGLQHALEQGTVHRDVKPHNLMLTPRGQIKILDFGLSRFASETSLPEVVGPWPCGDEATGMGGVTSPYRAMGTPDYLAPEEARDARQADIRADVYSLGCTLYHLLSGQVPFPAETAGEKIRCHVERTAVPLVELVPDIPLKLSQVVERMMAKDPADRYQTPAEVGLALAPYADRPRPRVLVVDDSAPIREAFRVALEWRGYTVDCAANGREALERLREGPLPGLILLDLIMPVMDGLKFLEERKRDPALMSIPVLVISAADPSQAQAMALGAADYLAKPVELDVLADKVERHAK
jgi:serine/threonine protein kinase